MKKVENESRLKKYVGSGAAIGLCVGVLYGIIFDNLALGIGIGLCFGGAIGTGVEKKKRTK